MKNIALIFLSSILLLFSCNNDSSSNLAASNADKKQLQQRIKSYEDSLSSLQSDQQKVSQITSLTQIEYINRLKAYIKAFPNDIYSADCMFKIHMVYDNLRAPLDARAYADTLLTRFPNFKNRKIVLESLGSSYDINSPRDTSKVRYYYELLLKEPGISSEQKKDIRARLAKLNLSFEQYILQVN